MLLLHALMVLMMMSACESVLFPQDVTDETGTCLRSGDPLIPCVMSGAVSWAESVKFKEIHIGEGLVLIPEPGDDIPLQGDPREARTLIDAMDRAMSRRRLIWDIDWLYPGLAMVVSRSPDPKLYFTVDRRAVPHEAHESTGRLIMKRTLLPVLLGVNVKLATLAPLLIAALVILVKKALLLSKLSLLASGLTWFRGSMGSGSSSFQGSGGGGHYGAGPVLFGQPTRDEFFSDGWYLRDHQPLVNTSNSFF